MPTSRASIAIVATLIAVAPRALTARPGPVAIETRMNTLSRRVDDLKKTKSWDEAFEAIQEMVRVDPDHPKIYLNVVLLESRRGLLQEAEAKMESLRPRSEPGRTYGQGVLSAFNNRGEEAERTLARALRLYRALGHSAGQAACHTALGNVTKNRSAWAEAVRHYEAARPFLERIGDEQGRLDVLHQLADLEGRRGNLELALKRNKELLVLRERQGDRSWVAKSWHAIGECQRDLGHTDDAIESFRKSQAIRREIRDWEGEVSDLTSLAILQESAGDFVQATTLLEEAIKTASPAGDVRSRAELSRQLGRTLVAAGRGREAVPVLENAMSLSKTAAQERIEVDALAWLGIAHSQIGDFRRSRPELERALDRAHAVKEPGAEAVALTGLGNLSFAAGDFAQSLVRYERALSLHRDTKDRIGELNDLNNLASCYFGLGHLKRSRRYIEQSLCGFKALGDEPRIARAHNNLSVLLAEEGRLDESLTASKVAIQIRESSHDRRGAAIAHVTRAATLGRLGRREHASLELSKALDALRQSGDRTYQAEALNLLGEVDLSLGQSEMATSSHRRALELAEEGGVTEEIWRAHAGLASVYERDGRRTEALGESLQAIDVIERVRGGLVADAFKMRFLAGKIGLYEQGLSLMIPSAVGEISPRVVSESFRLVERAKARSLLDRLSESRSHIRSNLPSSMRDREQEILDDLSGAAVRLAACELPEERAELRQKVDEARERLDRFEIDLHREAPRYGELLYPRAKTLDEIQERTLGEREVFLEYFIGANHAWVWVIDRRTAALQDLGPSAAIRDKVRAFLREISSSALDISGKQRDHSAAESLGRAILPKALPAGARIIVAPDGPLLSIPFDALRARETFLAAEHEVVVVPSASALGLMRKSPSPLAAGGFLGVGDPSRKGQRGLPFSRLELETVADLFPPDARTLLTGANATKASLRALDLEGFRFIHFATHGWLDPEDPIAVGLQLTPEQEDQPMGLLSSDDVLNLRIASEVVVLSACESGRGEALPGEGLVGLARSFLDAGSRMVLVSLWDVGDRSTAAFMQDFYRRVKQGATVSEALRRTKLDFLSSDEVSRRQIRHWAPFVLVGDPGGSSEESNRIVPGATK